MRVFGYCRVSTAAQANEGESLDTQIMRVKGYAMSQGWTIADEDIHVERGVSGSVPLAEREAGRKLLAAVGKGNTIITPKLDRMFRSASDALATLEVLKADSVGLVMMDLGGDVTGNGISKLVFTILSAVAEAERDRLRERIREVKRHKAAQGDYNGGKRTFGYDIVDGKLVENATEQETLREMMERRASGLSYHKIGAEFGKDAKSVKRMLDRLTH
ncbi:MAG: recombinase family protein [Mesorhizobium sp.]|nr:MAG: recombinase family protein [Mesorhizobium sp.]